MSSSASSGGGRFDFDDGGTFCGGWAEGRAHGHGVCTGPKGEGEYCGAWAEGFETSGVYSWGTTEYEGQWQEGRRHGFGAETRGRWVYRGEWTDGLKGRYGTRQCLSSSAKYDGTWAGGLQDGYGSETYADGGTFQGQWVKGMRHGYGVRSSAPFGLAAHTRRQSLRKSPTPNSDVTTLDRRPEEGRGGFVLRDSRGGTLGRAVSSPEPSGKRSPFKGLLSKTKRGDRTSYEDEVAVASEEDEGSANSFDVDEGEAIDGNVIETYMGEWKNDRRSGFGIAERSDGIKYEGEWHNNKKFGYGRTTYKDGAVERGKYRNNILLSARDRKHLFLLRSPKFKERVDGAVNGAHRASQIALQKADIAISRTATARGKAEQADVIAKQSRSDAEIARRVARTFAPEFQPQSTNKGFLKPKFPSTHDSTEFATHHFTEEKSNNPDFLKPDVDGNYLSPEPPSGSAFLDLFRNNPDRRPSNAGFLRRPSTIHLRRPSTVVEHSIVPSQFDQHYLQGGDPVYHQKQDQSIYNQNQPIYHQNQPIYQQNQPIYHQNQPIYPQNPSIYQPNPSNYPQNPSIYHQNPAIYHQQDHSRFQPPQVSIQQVIDDHLHHYYHSPPPEPKKKRPAVDLTELSVLYGVPISRPLMDDDEESPVVFPGRRSTLPTVMDQNLLDAASLEGGVVRTGSLYGGTRKVAAEGASSTAAKASSIVGARKKSLPDIGSASFGEPRVLTREAIAVLSSQRRETMRREEEEAIRLRQNPLLYLVSPEVWDWFASQQLVIMIVVINVALGFIFFKVIL